MPANSPSNNQSVVEVIRAHRAELLDPSSILPEATYRLQFHAGFTFEDGRRLVPYLHALGITHVYASPYQEARPGSLHGYDVSNPNALNPELGDENDYRAFVQRLADHGMSQVLDVVPNHMGIGHKSNTWWLDVLENGQASVYANFFDIDWDRLSDDPHSAGKVILPILGDQYGKALERGELTLEFDGQQFSVRYYDYQLPLASHSWRRLLVQVRDALATSGVRGSPDMLELERLIGGLAELPPSGPLDADAGGERKRRQDSIKSSVAQLCDTSRRVKAAICKVVHELSGEPGKPSSFDALDGLLNEQFYRVAYWRVAAEEINYRRFFDINDLAALRMEDPRVFDAAHALLLVLASSRRRVRSAGGPRGWPQ